MSGARPGGWAWLVLLAVAGCAPEAPGSDSGVVSSTGSGTAVGGTSTGTVGTTTSTGTTTSGTGDVVFVAQGHVGRTLVSLDRGRTWVHDQSADPTLECWADNWLPDCDHREDSARGLAAGDGVVVATFGWGAPGGLVRSEDGQAWETVFADSTAAGVAWGNGVFLAGDWLPKRSTDGGRTWEELGWVVDFNVRRTVFVEAGGGRFLLANDGPLVVSADAGDTWTTPPSPAGCGNDVMFTGGIAYGNGVIVGVSGDGTACRSVDDGASFEPAGPVGAWLSSRLVFDGSQFVVFSPGSVHTSVDGQSWSTAALAGGLTLDAVAHADGSWVGVGGWYADQRWWHSDDGHTWTQATGPGGHPIYELIGVRP